MVEKRYLAAKTVSDVWICYPWEATYVFSSMSTVWIVPYKFWLIETGILMNTTALQSHSHCNSEI